MVSGGWLLWGVERHTVSGTVVLQSRTFADATPGTTCRGTGSHSGVRGGASAALLDPRGETLSSGRLSEGEDDGVGCVFTFRLEDVPRADRYELTVDGVDHGTYTDDDLSAHDWAVEIRLGSD